MTPFQAFTFLVVAVAILAAMYGCAPVQDLSDYHHTKMLVLHSKGDTYIMDPKSDIAKCDAMHRTYVFLESETQQQYVYGDWTFTNCKPVK
jgi:hypothetical protein